MSTQLPDITSRIRIDTSGLDQAGRSADAAGSRIGGSLSKASIIAGGALAGVGIAAFASSVVSAGADFDSTLRQMAAVAGVPKEQLKGLSALALKMGADTKYSAQQAADAMLELSKGGMTAAEIKAGVLKQTLTLAAAGGLDLAAAGTTMSNAMHTFGLTAGQAGQVAAALAGGANASTASVDSLGQALSQVGPGAKLAGLSIQETVAALAAFDNAGIKGSDAGTSLKTMLTRLVPQTDAAAGAMSKLGLKFTDAHGSFLPLRDVAEQLHDKLSGLSEAQRTSALATIFGSDATRAASVLMEQGAAGIDKYTKATSDQTAAQKVADASMQGVAGALESLGGSWDTVKTQAGLALAPMIEGVARFSAGAVNQIPSIVGHLSNLDGAFGGVKTTLGNLVKTFSPLAEDAFNVVKAVAGVALPAALDVLKAAFKAVGAVVEAVTGFLASHKTTVQAITLTVGTFAAILGAQSLALGIASTATAAWGAVTAGVTLAVNSARAAVLIFNLALAANPIGLVVTALAALTVGLVYAYQHSETFRDIVKGAFDKVSEAIGWVVDKLGDMFGLLGHVPGFGWAKDAAAAMHGAAEAARALGDRVNAIPSVKRVTIDVITNGIGTAASVAAKLGRLDGARAAGGPVRAGGAYLVGERRPEIFVPDVSGRILPSLQAATAGSAPAVAGSYEGPLRADVLEQNKLLRQLLVAAQQQPGAVADALNSVAAGARLAAAGRPG